MGSRFEKKDDDEYFMPFQGLEKGIVLQEKRIFSEAPINARKCSALITKLLWLLAQGDKFTKGEATDVFFAVTKLFQSKDIPLRRMMFLMLKELSTMSDDVIIVISSLTKDIISKVDLYRANAIRVLARIADNSLLPQVERHLKQAILDKDPHVASAALVSGIHLMNTSADLVKRWVNEVQEALNSKHTMVQYHALALMYQIKQHDRLAVSKLVMSMVRNSPRSPFAHTLLIRFACEVLEDGASGEQAQALNDYLESCLRNKSDMVMYEAARAISNRRNVTAKELTPVVSVLQLFLSSPKPTLRFAAVRTLNKIAMTAPLSVVSCNLDMENLIADSNRSIATLAISTLLKTGSEASVDRLMKQIGGFMGDISDEFKIVVVDAIRTLCIKFPQKHRTLMSFLSNILRDEGGFEYKKAIVNTILEVVNVIPEAKELGLTHLCEFIEDCEFTYLSTKILHLLGSEGPATATPSKYIRYIYNRVSLENAYVRASAVSALAKFGASLEQMRPNIVVLLRRCQHDSDDEVRDRATFYLKVLEGKDPQLTPDLILAPFTLPLANLESSLNEFLQGPTDAPFNIGAVSTFIEPPKPKEATPSLTRKGPKTAGPSGGVTPAANDQPVDDAAKYSAQLGAIPQFAKLGKLFRSSSPVELTESEAEYLVSCVKHIFPQHVVFQFNCKNTLNEQQLERVQVRMASVSGDALTIESQVPADVVPYGPTAVPSYVCVRRDSEAPMTGTFSCTLKFMVKEVDPSTGDIDDFGIDDEYQLEDVELATSDYTRKAMVANFQEEWDKLGDEGEIVETFNLSTMKSLQDAVKEIIQYLGMYPCDSTEQVPPKKTKHILYLAGRFVGDVPVLARCRMKSGGEGQGVDLELTVRSPSADISQVLASAI
eukprot:TRINITY_DN1157_c0_g1_i1.p1 TRINITY_DN1157_c0_g1~~TRINITY_DN1157_c0_g1_i1.p1  ORF type:complete len:887 (+),score=324.88 TRINITY_DN1157_c0_g1_i1:90-2750(+)